MVPPPPRKKEKRHTQNKATHKTTHAIKPLHQSSCTTICDIEALIGVLVSVVGLHVNVNVLTCPVQGLNLFGFTVRKLDVVEISLCTGDVLSSSDEIVTCFSCHEVLGLNVPAFGENQQSEVFIQNSVIMAFSLLAGILREYSTIHSPLPCTFFLSL